MAVPKQTQSLHPIVARLLERHKETFEEARREFGEHPEETVAQFFRETYDADLLNEVSQDMFEHGPGWLDDACEESRDE